MCWGCTRLVLSLGLVLCWCLFTAPLTGLVKDECSLRDLNVISGAKMMVVGSTIDDVITVQAPPTSSLRSESEAVSAGKN